MQMGDSRDFSRGNKLTFVELLQCVPLIVTLEINVLFMEVIFKLKIILSHVTCKYMVFADLGFEFG